MDGIKIRPQPGYQMNALSSSADIVIGGGSAGAGKTYCLLIEPLKHINKIKDFGGVIFRRTTPQIRNQGGLWDTSTQMYSLLGATPKESSLEWYFNFNNRLKFSHIEYEKNKLDWQGSQIPFIGFDELTHFSESMFFYLLSRNRSVCGIKPFVRATCNPDPESWVADFIKYWIDQETGYPIPERNGQLRYFIKISSVYVWGDSKQEVYDKAKFAIDELIRSSGLNFENIIKSATFISGSIYENKKLLDVDSGYLSNLMSLDEQEKSKLLGGCWKRYNDDSQLYEWEAFQGMFNNVIDCDKGSGYIVADIAMSGSNKLAVGYFRHNSLEDLIIMPRNDGKQAVEAINTLAKRHLVPNANIVFDADGVGAYVSGYVRGAVAFHGGGAVIPIQDSVSKKIVKENYFNLKNQLYFHSANKVNNNEYHISEHVANMMYDDKMTVRQRFNFERKAIKRLNKNLDGKIRIISKDEQKVILGGDSPDLMDMLMMRSYFDLPRQGKVTSYSFT